MEKHGSIPGTPLGGSGRLVDYGFFAALLLVGYLLYQTVEPVLVPVVLGAFAAVLARPIHSAIASRIRSHPRVAAGATSTLVVLLVLLPAVFLGVILLQELMGLAGRAATFLDKQGFDGLLAKVHVPRRIRIHVEPEQVASLVNTVVTKVGALVSRFAAAAAALLVGMFLFVISLYYFLIDGPRWLNDAARLVPMRSRYVRAFAREFDSVSHALFYGSVVTAVAQGAIAGLGYLILGVSQPLLLGAVTAVLSVTPIVGTTVVWAPVGTFLVASGHTGAGLGVIVWNSLITSTVDNVVRPLLMRGRMRLHPLLVFLSLIGGVAAFGMVGLLFGPLAAALFLAAVRIYDRDYRQRLDPDGSGSPQ